MGPRVLTAAVMVWVIITACGDSEGSSTAPTDTSGATPASEPPSESTASSDTQRTSGPASTSSVPYPETTSEVIVEDGDAGSIDEMFERSDLVVTGTVSSTESLGRPDGEEDPLADEYVAIQVDVESVLKGGETETVVLGWDAVRIDEAGERVGTVIANGVPPPRNGDRLLLFLINPDPAFVEALGGIPTHQPIQLDGIAFLDENGAISLTERGSPLGEAGSLEAVRAEV